MTGSIQFKHFSFIPMVSINGDWLSHNWLSEIQWHQGCNVIGYERTRDPSWQLRYLQW